MTNCLQLLNCHSAGTALYVLACLCPEDFSLIVKLVRLDLRKPHRHRRLRGEDLCREHTSAEDVLVSVQAYTGLVAEKDFAGFWLELTKKWLLTCPVDPNYYPSLESGEDLYCQRLRSDLIDRILNIS